MCSAYIGRPGTFSSVGAIWEVVWADLELGSGLFGSWSRFGSSIFEVPFGCHGALILSGSVVCTCVDCGLMLRYFYFEEP